MNRKRIPPSIVPIVLSLAWLFSCNAAACAHGIGAQASLKDGKLVIEVFFDDDSPAKDAKIRLLDSRKNVVIDANADLDGKYAVAVPPAGSYKLHVDAGAGHLAKVDIVIPDGAESANNPNLAVGSGGEPEQAAPIVVSAGPTREHATGVPWLKIILGIAIVVGLGEVSRRWLAARESRK